MLTKPNTEKLLKNADNRYELVIAISRRARQIVDGDETMVNSKEFSKTTIAALEFGEEKYHITRENENTENNK